MHILHHRRRQLRAQARIPPAVAQPRRTTSAHGAPCALRSGGWDVRHSTPAAAPCPADSAAEFAPDSKSRAGAVTRRKRPVSGMQDEPGAGSSRPPSRPPSRLPSAVPSADGHVPLARLASSGSRGSRRSGGYVQEDDGDDPAQAGTGGAGRAGGGGRVLRQLLYSELLSRPGGPWAWLEVRTRRSRPRRALRVGVACRARAEYSSDWWTGRQRPAGRERA